MKTGHFSTHAPHVVQSQIASGDTLGIAVFEGASNTGGTVALSSQLNIDNNTVSQNSLGVFVSLYAFSATATQTGQMNNNSVTSNGFGTVASESAAGVSFFDSASQAGVAIQTFNLVGNQISGNTTNGILTKASGTGATQTVTLAGGNHINANTGFGLYLLNSLIAPATVTVHINSNDLSGNSSGTTHTAGAITLTP